MTYQKKMARMEILKAFRAQSKAFSTQDRAAMIQTTKDLEWKIKKYTILFNFTEEELAEIEYEMLNMD